MPLVLLTDEINSGKSSFCLQLVKRLMSKRIAVQGWLTPAWMEGEKKVGQQIVFLRNLEESAPRPFFRYDIGFMPTAFDLPDLDAICDVVVMDELGPLELAGHGFYLRAQNLLERSRTAIVVSRTSIADELTEFLGIKPSLKLTLKEARQNLEDVLCA